MLTNRNNHLNKSEEYEKMLTINYGITCSNDTPPAKIEFELFCLNWTSDKN